MSAQKAGPKPIATFALLVALVTALIASAVPAAAGAAPPGCKNRTNTTYQTAARVRDARGRARASGGVPGDRRRERRRVYPGTARRHRGLRRQRRLRRRAARGRGLRRDARRVPRSRSTSEPIAPAAHAGQRDVRDRRVHGQRGRATSPQPSIAVDINLTPPRDRATSGCEAGPTSPDNDFAAPADIALIQRGTLHVRRARRRTPRPPVPRR